jgi:hypothetical protein
MSSLPMTLGFEIYAHVKLTFAVVRILKSQNRRKGCLLDQGTSETYDLA